MRYKVKNKTRTVRKFREHKNPQGHWLRAGEEIVINNPPVVANPKVFEVTEINESSSDSKESYEKSSKNKTTKKRSKSKEEEIEDDTTRHME